MKNTKRAVNIAKKALIAFLAATIAFTAIAPAEVEAATKKITLKSHGEAKSPTTARKKAKTVKKGNTYEIKINNDYGSFHGYARFVAPKKTTYTFEFSGLKESKKNDVLGCVYVTTPTKYAGMDPVYLDTKGGPDAYMYLGSVKYSKYLTKRTGKVKLKKGQEIFLFFDFDRAYYSKGKYMKIKLKIKS